MAVPIHRHETESRIDGIVDDGEVQPVAFGNSPPVVDASASERIHAQADLRAPNGVHVDHIAKVADVGRKVVVLMCRAGAKSLLVRYPQYVPKAPRQKLVRLCFNPSGDAALRGTAVGRVVFKASVIGWIVRRRDHDAVGESGLTPTVVSENRV